MGKLRKLRRQIERNPEKWMYKSEWARRWNPEEAARVRYAIGGWRRSKGGVSFMPSCWASCKSWSGRKYPYSYQRFVARVLKDMGYNIC